MPFDGVTAYWLFELGVKDSLHVCAAVYNAFGCIAKYLEKSPRCMNGQCYCTQVRLQADACSAAGCGF